MGVTIPSVSDLSKSAQKFRKELLMMPVIALEQTLQHMSLRTGIRYKETVGELLGNIELGPYDKARIDSTGLTITPRELETFFGSVIKDFDPNTVYSSIYGSSITKGEGLKETEITKQVLAYLAAQLGVHLNKQIWGAVRNPAGTTTATLFNGFDTITTAEVTAGNIAAAKKNFVQLTVAIDSTNAVDQLKAIYEGASDELQGQAIKMFLPKDVYNAYNKDYQATNGALPYNREYKKTFLEGSDDLCELVALPNKKASPYIHLTTKSNMLIGVDQMGDKESVLVEKHAALSLQFVATMFFGCQFETLSPERLFVAKLKA